MINQNCKTRGTLALDTPRRRSDSACVGMVRHMNGMLIDLAQARSALRVAAGHASELIRSWPDPRAPVPGLEWTVGQTAAHMVAVPMNYLCYATGQAEPEA